MREHRFAVATAAATLGLLVVGGLVHPAGASLACPDWPLCRGELLPALEGGVAIDLAHRAAALVVAAMAIALAGLVLRRRREPTVRVLAVVAVALVLAQAVVGAIAVRLSLPLLASAGHLALSMAFLGVVVALAVRLEPASSPPGPAPSRLPRRLPALAGIAVYAEIVLGGFVRHANAALACNSDLLLCGGTLLPAGGPAQLHLAHRLLGAFATALVLAAAGQVLRSHRASAAAVRLAVAAPALAVLALVLGLATVGSSISIPIVSLHLAAGALLLATAVSLFLALRPQGAARATPVRRRAGPLAPTVG